MEELLGPACPIAALSGPNHAEEIVFGVPAATVVASASPATAAFFQDLLGSEAFRVYTSTDTLGVEPCVAQHFRRRAHQGEDLRRARKGADRGGAGLQARR